MDGYYSGYSPTNIGNHIYIWIVTNIMINIEKTYIYICIYIVYIYYIYMDINIGWLIIIVGTLQTFLGDSQDSVGKSGH
jgi:hypothetical protein